MRHALRRFGNQALVDAEDAPRHGDYICPACRNPVFKRNGDSYSRAPCFVHFSGYGSEACELFISINGGDTSHFNPSEEHSALTSRPWSIALAMQLGSERPMPGWGLTLSIPTPGVTDGRLRVDVGGRLQNIDLAYNQAATRHAIAHPSHAPYRVVEVSPRFGPLDVRLIKECDGLRRGCTAFGHLACGGKLIRRATEIFPGEEYVIVWHSHDAPTIPEPFDAVPISADKEWNGAIIAVPRHLGSVERRWLTEQVGLPIKDALPTIVQIWPPLSERRTPQLLEALPHRQLLFSVDSLKGEDAALFFRARGGQDQVVRAQEMSSAILAVQPGAADEFKIVARAQNAAEVLVELKQASLSWQSSGITLNFEDGGVRTSVSLFDRRTKALLSAVRRGTAILQSSSGPKYCQVKVRKRVRGIWVPEQEVECEANALSGVLNTVLNDISSDLQIDFGSFGHLLLDGTRRRHEVVQLSPRLRRQILGYLFHLPHTPIQLNKNDIGDEVLIATFRRVKPTTQSLTQHVALTRILNTLTT